MGIAPGLQRRDRDWFGHAANQPVHAPGHKAGDHALAPSCFDPSPLAEATA